MLARPPAVGIVAGSLGVVAASLVVATVIPLPAAWLPDVLIIVAGVAVLPALIVLGQHYAPGSDYGGRTANAVLAVLYLAVVAITSYNMFVLDIGTGPAGFWCWSPSA